MRVLSKPAIVRLVRKHPDSLEPLTHWYVVARQARWRCLADVRQDFRHADVVGELTDLSIAGTRYRLIASIKYRWQMVYIRQILTHAEYDKEKWKP